jgi:hypothetical protein
MVLITSPSTSLLHSSASSGSAPAPSSASLLPRHLHDSSHAHSASPFVSFGSDSLALSCFPGIASTTTSIPSLLRSSPPPRSPHFSVIRAVASQPKTNQTKQNGKSNPSIFSFPFIILLMIAIAVIITIVNRF